MGFNIAVQMKAYSLDFRQKIIQVYENDDSKKKHSTQPKKKVSESSG